MIGQICQSIRSLSQGEILYKSPTTFIVWTVSTGGCQNTQSVIASDWMQVLFGQVFLPGSFDFLFQLGDVGQEGADRPSTKKMESGSLGTV